jgi:hypothetical protein
MVHHHPSPHHDSPSPFTPAHFAHDPFAFHPQGRRSVGPGLPGSGSPHRVFPIRASQPSHPTPVRPNFMPHLSDQSEHHLRRKTPNGTIDAGYDGTPAQLASGPPPLKHMIRAGGVNAVPTATGSLHDYRAVQHPVQSS